MKKNSIRVHQLKEELRSWRQRRGMPVEVYYNKLKAIWEDLATHEQRLSCQCNCDFERVREEERLHQFLMGLDSLIYTNVKTEILEMDLLPSLEQAYSMVTQEEEKLISSNREVSEGSIGLRETVNVDVEEGVMEMIETGLGITFKKDKNFGQWYSQVCVYGEMMRYYDISGCYILCENSMTIWNVMRSFFSAAMKKAKVKECCYPMLVTADALEKEKNHIEGFAPEVAWVTQAGKSKLEKPIAIRPTSETIFYPDYSKLIKSHSNLPLKCYQWSNVVRWEFSKPTPFIRSREFLWHEGHTAFATKQEADEEVLEVLELYRQIYEDKLAVPVIKGMKSENEKFSGALYTTSVEAFIPEIGRGIQGATSHCLGQNFAKMYNIRFENDKGEKKFVWQNSWGYSARTIGVMIMTHGDDKGLMFPPKVAPVQVIVIPVPFKNADNTEIFEACRAVESTLEEAGIRVEDDMSDKTPGWKYSDWEMKGVPLRIEIGPKDLAKDQVRVVRRDNGVKLDIPRGSLVEQVKDLLEKIQQNMFEVAKQKRDAACVVVKTWDEFVEALNQKKLILAPWCDEVEVEKDVKARTKDEIGAAKTLCSPFDQPEMQEGTLCFASGKLAKKWTYWGRSY